LKNSRVSTPGRSTCAICSMKSSFIPWGTAF
jgi:hypothetical protein